MSGQQNSDDENNSDLDGAIGFPHGANAEEILPALAGEEYDPSTNLNASAIARQRGFGWKIWRPDRGQANNQRQNDRVFGRPEQIAEACLLYLQWCEDNPMREHKTVSSGGVACIVAMPKARTPTITGFCNYLGVRRTVWSDWRKHKKDPDYQAGMEEAEQLIWQAKFELAAARLSDPGLIAREMGLADKREMIGGAGNAPVKISINPVAKGTFLPPPDEDLKNVTPSGLPSALAKRAVDVEEAVLHQDEDDEE